MSARRSLLTATAAGALLGALWFVPSANATATFRSTDSPENPGTEQVVHTEQHRATPSSADGEATHTAPTAMKGPLADTGAGVDTTPYLIGGTAFLGLGAGFVAYSVRRERQGPAY
ncbi:hypothetical protein ACGFSB_16165 [Streptomyces sp. NPDC048441]|uniref:hypothetical protein n=1 Tax=Streptomyces sp. NPDC048441 TaxID=3365552 RepID=UPI00371708C1